VARTGDLRDGEMRVVAAGTERVLLVRVGDTFHAVSPECTHHHAALVDGALNGSRLVCPWHHACFDVRTGSRDEPPALDGLTRYDVAVDGDEILVALSEPTRPRPRPRTARSADRRTFVVLGGGAAGQQAVEELRELGFDGRLVMVTAEDALPYDRPHLSKEYLREAGHGHAHDLSLRDAAFYAERGIELWRGRRVTRLVIARRTIELDDGSDLAYDAVLVATGAVPRTLGVPGADLPNVFTLRSQDDADRIAAAAPHGARAVVIGASFIGMEVAASLRERGLAVTVVAPGAAPLERALGGRIGAILQLVHEERGVAFRMGARVTRIAGTSRAEAVELADGGLIDADLVVAGVGVTPATSFVADLALAGDGGVPVDETLRAADGAWAAGDIAQYPDPRGSGPVRIEHWRVAQQQGRLAARNMLGAEERVALVPFFWTEQYDVRLIRHRAEHQHLALEAGDAALPEVHGRDDLPSDQGLRRVSLRELGR